MKRILKRIITLFVCLILLSCSAVSVSAESASIGDIVTARVYISGQSDMTGISSTLIYDGDYLDPVTYDLPFSISSCNDLTEGEIIWVALFDAVNGLDFSEKTEVFTVTFIAKQDIDNVDGLISNNVSEAYNADFNEIDFSNITVETEVAKDDSNADNTSSKTEFVISKYEGVGDISSDEEVVSSERSNIERSNIERNETDTSTDESIVSSSDIESITETSENISSKSTVSYVSSEVADRSPVKLDTSSGFTSSEASETTSTYIVGLVIGVIVIIILAIIVVVLSGKATNAKATHMK